MKMLILRGKAGYCEGRDWPRGALHEQPAIEFAPRRGYHGQMLDIAGTAYRAVRSKSWRWRSTGATNVVVNGKHMNLRFRKRGASVATLAAAGALVCAAPAAQALVALVEGVHGNPVGVEFMDYVSVGKVIPLGPSQSVVLGYVTSCWREIITGGTVTVGHGQSEVQGGSVTRTKVTCDGARLGSRGNKQTRAQARAFEP